MISSDFAAPTRFARRPQSPTPGTLPQWPAAPAPRSRCFRPWRLGRSLVKWTRIVERHQCEAHQGYLCIQIQRYLSCFGPIGLKCLVLIKVEKSTASGISNVGHLNGVWHPWHVKGRLKLENAQTLLLVSAEIVHHKQSVNLRSMVKLCQVQYIISTYPSICQKLIPIHRKSKLYGLPMTMDKT